MEEITSSVEDIEAKAERILEAARKKASEIFQNAKEESEQIVSSELSLDKVKADCQKIIAIVKEEADTRLADSKKQAQELNTAAGKKLDEIVENIANIVSGAKSG